MTGENAARQSNGAVRRAGGTLFDGQSAEAQPVRVALDGRQLRVMSAQGEPILSLLSADIRLVPGGPPDTQRLRLPGSPEARLLIGTPGFIRALHDAGMPRPGSAVDRMKRLTLFVLALLSGFGAIFALAERGVPLIATGVAALVPETMETRISANIRGQLVRTAVASPGAVPPRACTAPAGSAALAKLARQIEAAGGPKGLKITVIDAALANAFALPGNEVIVFAGMLDLVQSPGELAGVVAHEAGHVAFDHPMRLMFAAGTRQLWQVFGMGSVEGTPVYGQVASALLDTRHSRRAEYQADAYAVSVLEEAGWSAEPFALLLRRFAAAAGDAEAQRSWIQSHPASALRADGVLALASDRPGAPPLETIEFLALKNICNSPEKGRLRLDPLGRPIEGSR